MTQSRTAWAQGEINFGSGLVIVLAMVFRIGMRCSPLAGSSAQTQLLVSRKHPGNGVAQCETEYGNHAGHDSKVPSHFPFHIQGFAHLLSQFLYRTVQPLPLFSNSNA
jgi:hypothetical protein